VFRRYTPWLALTAAAGVLVVTRPTAADDPLADAKDKKPAMPASVKPGTVKVERGPFTAAVTLKGVVQTEKAVELSVRPKAWSGPLLVKHAVEHGTPVRVGDVLVQFDTEKLDLAIRDARQERDLAEIAIRQAEAELPLLEKQLPLDLATAERQNKQAAEDLKRFLEIDRPLAEESAAFMVKSATFYLEYAKDELAQLRKMYRDKDLTEETERIILKRYEHYVEMYEFFLKEAKIQAEQALKVYLPRREQEVKEAVEKAALALARARDVQPLGVQQKHLALAKLRYDARKAGERLDDLEADRASLTVRALADGLAYYGRYVHGQWVVPGGPQGPPLTGVGPVNPGDVFMTIVTPNKLVVRAEAEEKELPGLRSGLAARLTPTADPDRRLPAKLARLAAAPLNGKFELRVEPDGEQVDGLVPGMTCSVRFVTARKERALTTPAAAVFTDEAEDAKYVYRSVKGGQPEKRTVKVGLTSGDRVEILDGLAEGDEILASKPKTGE
jgi:multidrug efflux pump subunit AcrA (membrane-fusion protein)